LHLAELNRESLRYACIAQTVAGQKHVNCYVEYEMQSLTSGSLEVRSTLTWRITSLAN
jgi:hypothetical protein